MNSFLYNLSILWVDFDVFISLQKDFLTVHHVFHLWKSFFFVRFCDLLHMFFMFEIQSWIQFTNRDLKWATTMKKIWQFYFLQQSFFLMIMHAILIWYIMLLFFILFSAWETTEFRWKFREKMYVSAFTMMSRIVL